MYPDALHNTSLGLAHHLMNIITDKLRETDAFDEVDQRLRELAKTAFVELHLPARACPPRTSLQQRGSPLPSACLWPCWIARAWRTVSVRL